MRKQKKANYKLLLFMNEVRFQKSLKRKQSIETFYMEMQRVIGALK